MKTFVIESRGFYGAWTPVKTFTNLTEATKYKNELIPEKEKDYRIIKVEKVTEVYYKRQLVIERT
jgi:hypothetical protein